jgi:hypothetical protein
MLSMFGPHNALVPWLQEGSMILTLSSSKLLTCVRALLLTSAPLASVCLHRVSRNSSNPTVSQYDEHFGMKRSSLFLTSYILSAGIMHVVTRKENMLLIVHLALTHSGQ